MKIVAKRFFFLALALALLIGSFTVNALYKPEEVEIPNDVYVLCDHCETVLTVNDLEYVCRSDWQKHQKTESCPTCQKDTSVKSRGEYLAYACERCGHLRVQPISQYSYGCGHDIEYIRGGQ